TDTYSYVRTFTNSLPITWDLLVEYLSKKEFLYTIYVGTVRRFTANYTMFLLPIAIFYITAVARFIKKYSSIPAISFILFMSMGYFSFSMAGLRQAIAMGVLLFATDKMLDKKYVSAGLLILLASGFHITTLIYFVALALCFLPLNKWFIALTAIISTSFYFAGNDLTNKIVEIVWGEERGYKEFEYGGISILILLIIVAVATFVFYPNILEYSKTRKLKKDNTLEIDTLFAKMLLFSIPFQVMAMYQANAFRIAMMFHFSMIALLPNVISKQKSRAVKIIANIVVALLLLYQLFAITYWSADINPFTFFWQV
ncbi:MAG: EpsG family protein, partial [Oscillospiraceae bacterium]